MYVYGYLLLLLIKKKKKKKKKNFSLSQFGQIDLF